MNRISHTSPGVSGGLMIACMCIFIFLTSTVQGQTSGSVVFRYGFAKDRVGLEASGWYADNGPESGHATDFEDQYDYSRITIGLTNNFIRAFLYRIGDLPGVSKPGCITFRLRRLGQSSKIIVTAEGRNVCTYLQKDPQSDRYEITGGTNPVPIFWGNREMLLQWHDYIFEYDGKKRTFLIDNDPATRIELKSAPVQDADFLSLGMGYQYGRDMFIDIESLRFAPPDKAPATAPASPRKDGPLLVNYADGRKWIECTFTGGMLNGSLIRWHPNGQKQSEGSYVNDQQDGVWTWWYQDGRVRLSACYNKGRLHGQYLRYYPDGQLETIVRFQQGMADGLFARWFPDGQPKFTGGYRKDLMEDQWAQWSNTGFLEWAHMSTGNKHDVFVKTWYPDGKLKTVKYLDQCVDHGAYEEYHPNGQIKIRGQYQQGKKTGVWTSYDEQGQPLLLQWRDNNVENQGNQQ